MLHLNDLVFEHICLEHKALLEYVWSDMDVIRYTNIKKLCDSEQIISRINRFQDHDIFVIWDSTKTHFLGIAGCPYIDKDKGEFGIFYQFRKSVWGNGYASKTVKGLITYMKQRYKTCTIYADVCVQNIASVRILEKYNFVLQPEEDEIVKENEVYKVHNYILYID